MQLKNRRDREPRFKLGEKVRIHSSRVRFNGLSGIVIEIMESPYADTLDKYRVEIAATGSDIFRDEELAPARAGI